MKIRTMMTRVGALVALLVAQTCATQPLAAQLQSEVVWPFKEKPAQGLTHYFQPTDDYREWWAEMNRCTQTFNSILAWKWVVVDADAFVVDGDSTHSRLSGTVLPEKHRIYLTRALLGARERVEHEMIHAQLWAAHDWWQHHTVADSVFKRCNFIQHE